MNQKLNKQTTKEISLIAMNIQVPFIIKTEQNDGYNYGEMFQPQMVFPYRPLHLPSLETPHAVQPPDVLGVENYYYQGYNMPVQIVQNTPQTFATTVTTDENNQQTVQPSTTEVSQFEQMDLDIKRKLIDAGYQYHDDNKDKALKPFSCDVCHKSFGRLSHVRRHQLLHTGEV